MSRYIDADRIVFWVRHVSSNGKLSDTDVRKVAFSDEIARIPTADVVPKSEVERLHEIINGFEEQSAKELQDFLRLSEKYEKAKAEVAREIFEEIDHLCIDLFGNFHHKRFAELKKKYTEGEQDV